MSITQNSCESFVEALASGAPTPGGGGASALVGAVGMALGSMVGNLTLGNKRYADVHEDIRELTDKAASLQTRLMELVEKDAQVFAPLSKAYGLPANTEEEKAHKAAVMAECLDACCQVPMAIMSACCEAIELHKAYGEKGTAIAISDVGVGVACCRAALTGASLNVFINTKAMKDGAKAEAYNAQAEAMLEKYLPMADGIYNQVKDRFKRN